MDYKDENEASFKNKAWGSIMHDGLHAHNASNFACGYSKDGRKFPNGYKESDRVFYMYAIDNLGEEMQITKEIEKCWDQYYKVCNTKFEHFANVNMDLICCPTKCYMCETRTI